MQPIKRLFPSFLLSLLLGLHPLDLEATWSLPVQISNEPASLNIGTTPLVIDNHSVALVGWLDGSVGLSQTLYSASLFPPFNGWTAPQTIYYHTISGTFPSAPTMAVDIFGNQTAGFGVIDPVTGAFTLNASRRPAGAAQWLPPITQTESGIPGNASLAIGNLGNFSVLLGLSTNGNPPFDIALVQLPATSSSWLPPLVFAQDNSSSPAVAAKTDAATTTFAWKVNTPVLQIQTAHFDFLTEQLSPLGNVPLPPFTTDIVGLDMAVDAQGNSILIYAAQIGSNRILYASTLLADQNSWSAPVLISNPAHLLVGASIATDISGNSTIFWGEAINPSQQFVRAATLPLASLPTQVTDLTSPANLNTIVDVTAKVAMDSFGNAVAIWGIMTDGTPSIQVSSKAIGHTWTSPETLSVSGENPLVTLSDQGTAVAAWLDSVSNLLLGRSDLSLFALMPPTNFTGTLIERVTPYGQTVSLVTSWTPSPAPNILSYEIYQNGVLIGTVPGEGPLTFTQSLNSSPLSDLYTLIAVASNGNRSLPVALSVQPPLAPPSHFIGKVIKSEFLTQTAYFLNMHWTPSSAANIASYEIFKNGKCIATIPGKGPYTFLQPLHSRHVKGEYVLIAVSADGSKSLSIPLVMKKKG